MEEILAGQRGARLPQRAVVTSGQRRGPLPPRAFARLLVQRTEQRVVVEPCALAIHVGAELPRPARMGQPLDVMESREGGAQRFALERPDVAVGDPPRCAHRGKLPALLRAERCLAAERFEVRDLMDRDVDRIDGHRRQRRVRRPIVNGHLVQRQNLEEVQAGPPDPAADEW